MLSLLASTSTMEHSGQVAETMSRSRDTSVAQPASGAGKRAPPFWSTFRKQPVELEQAGRENWER
ncbi:MAG: hypothetical protein E6I76_18255 [Chloroflexi bacterium]|nr:MAG: hypothetical protein E6I76_18255 [Chloroflexota bacterium]